MAGLGTEFAASAAGGALLGWWIDRELGSSPRALLTLSIVGIVGGLYNLIRSSLAETARRRDRATGQDAEP